ncbi:helix-turn-helix transcriptional regulator [Paraburkholderia flava]|uniref:helix-turn-helix transcriptional regulator n=1 Tax=Paraburkholderia flava TaxID=2547393 RepID=UPI00105FFE21|nr:helix-turn-helix transcriptional regulator [Paraburkholderia flava]
MFSTVYFAASSVLSCDGLPAALTARVLDGQLLEAARLAANYADTDEAGDDGYLALQILADLELALGRQEEAEETYRKTQKAIRHSRDAMRVVSVRNAGWQACFRNQFHVALTCFRRVAEDRSATPAQQLDSLMGATLVLFHLGCVQAACDRLTELAPLAAAHADPRWATLVDMLRRDLLAQHALHGAEQLADHIYWRSVVTSLEGLNTPATLAGNIRLPLLEQRLDYLRHLQSFADGRADAREPLRQYATWSRKAGLGDYHRSLCLEMTLGAIAARATAAAEELLEQSGAAALHGTQNARWYLDFLYCRAKIMQQQMRTQEFATLYGRYALASIQHVRADSVSLPSAAPEAAQSRSAPRADDVSARLPAKYRRAYRYLMDNLDQKDLSVREVASQIGVTERAMQGAFRKHLGLSPSELIRRQRMERIREELLDDDAPVARVLDVAKKWGVQHRSTLINGYRSVFNEAPSETMGR